MTQFVTFLLVDSFPATLRSEWAALIEIEDDRERRKRLEAYLDRGRGQCYLRRRAIAKLVEDALRLFHGKRYHLRSWVVMPNHVHVLFQVGQTPMAEILKGWKSCTSRKANQVLRRRGQFWQDDYWDTYMRSTAHEVKAVHYIESNPVKAGLVREPKDWPWSSARFRDACGRLQL